MKLRRHDLVHLTRDAWSRLRSESPQRRALLDDWRDHDHPLVIARHRGVAVAGRWSAGLAAPLAHDRERLALDLVDADVARVAAFPRAVRVATLPAALRDALDGVAARVHGAHGWQALTGDAYLHARSDIDLLVDVVDEREADAIASRLVALARAWPLDGELLFADGRAVAWREWAAWRAGRATGVLVKRIDGVTLEGRRAA